MRTLLIPVLAAWLTVTLISCDDGGTGPLIIIQPPRNVRISFTGEAVLLTWDASENGEEIGYEVWRSKDNVTDFEKIANLDKETLSYTDGAVELLAVYYYKVRTVYAEYPGRYSDETSLFTGYVWAAAGYDGYNYKIYRFCPGTSGISNSFVSPCRYPYGLAWDGSYLWLAGERGEDGTIYRLEPSSGNVLMSFESPGYGDPTGLAWGGGYLWLATNFVDHEYEFIYQIDPGDGSVVSSFNTPGNEPKGLAWDGTYLWNHDFFYTLYKIDPTTGNVVAEYDTPEPDLTGLAWDGSYLWGIQYTMFSDEYGIVHRINPITCECVSSFMTPVWGAQGLAIER